MTGEQWREQKARVHVAEHLLEFTGKTCYERLDFPGEKGAEHKAFAAAFCCSCMGGRGRREKGGEDKVVRSQASKELGGFCPG